MTKLAACYDHPRYWNIAFSDETVPEAEFVNAAALKYCSFPVRKILEPACGGGRQVIELARRGYEVTAFDLNPECVRFTESELRRHRISARTLVADMCQFDFNEKFDLAHCFVNSFRHLLNEQSATAHLRQVASALRPGGLYLLGLHLLPPDAEEFDCERWTIVKGKTRVTTTVRVLEFSRNRRIEVVRFSLKVSTPDRILRASTDHQLRIYRADQLKTLLRRVPEFQILGVFDFCYDIQQPLLLNDDLGDTVLVLRRCE